MNARISSMLLDQVLPRLRSAVPRAVRCVGCEDPQELIQDGAAMAAKRLVDAEARGKTVTAGNIAYYTIQHLKSGRRSTGNSCADVLASGTQLTGRSSVGSLEDEASKDHAYDAPLTFHELISNEDDDPAMQAMRRLDWEAFLSGLDPRLRTLVHWVSEGRTLKILAEHWRLSLTRVIQLKEKLLLRMREYFGAEMWSIAAGQPRWMDNIVAMRQWTACRHARSVAT